MKPADQAATPLSAAWLMVIATLLFALMGVCVKQASQHVSTAEVVFFRGLVGALFVGALALWRGLPLATRHPRQHLWRGVAGVTALSLWFYCIAHLPLATAVTLNYMSSVWMGVFLLLRQGWLQWRRQPARPVPRAMLGAIALGFVGVAMVLQPTVEREQWFEALLGVASGMLSAWAYLQVATLGRLGEPEHRVVFFFSLFGAAVGAAMMAWVHLGPAAAVGTPLHALPPAGWLWLLGIGLSATVAQLFMTRAYARGEPLAMASLQYLGIVHAFVLGVAFFGEPVHALAVLGTVLIVAAGIAANHFARALRA